MEPERCLQISTGCSFILSLSTEISCDFLLGGGFVCDKAATLSDHKKGILLMDINGLVRTYIPVF